MRQKLASVVRVEGAHHSNRRRRFAARQGVQVGAPLRLSIQQGDSGSLHPLARIAARSGSFLLVWSEVHTQHAIQQNLRRLNTPSQLLFVMGPGRKSTVATPSDTDNSTHSHWGGSPLLLSAYVDERYRSALDPKEGISTKARALLQRGTCVNTRGVPLFYNRLHFLTKTAAQSTATPLAYDRDHIPPTAQQCVVIQLPLKQDS